MNIIAQLIKIANELDEKGEFELANETDEIVRQYADVKEVVRVFSNFGCDEVFDYTDQLSVYPGKEIGVENIVSMGFVEDIDGEYDKNIGEFSIRYVPAMNVIWEGVSNEDAHTIEQNNQNDFVITSANKGKIKSLALELKNICRQYYNA